MKKSHTVLSVTTRNIPGREIPDPHPIVIPSKIATYINANKINIKVSNKLFTLRNTLKIHRIEKTYIVTRYVVILSITLQYMIILTYTING